MGRQRDFTDSFCGWRIGWLTRRKCWGIWQKKGVSSAASNLDSRLASDAEK